MEVSHARQERHRTDWLNDLKVHQPIVGHVLPSIFVRGDERLIDGLSNQDVYTFAGVVREPGVKVFQVRRPRQLKHLILCRILVIIVPLVSRVVLEASHRVDAWAGFRHPKLDERVVLQVERGRYDRLCEALNQVRFPEDAAGEFLWALIIKHERVGLGEHALYVCRNIKTSKIDDGTLEHASVSFRRRVLLTELFALRVQRRDCFALFKQSIQVGAFVEDRRIASGDHAATFVFKGDVRLLDLHLIVSSVVLVHGDAPVEPERLDLTHPLVEKRILRNHLLLHMIDVPEDCFVKRLLVNVLCLKKLE